MSTIAPTSVDVIVSLPLRRFTTNDYLQMIDAGILGPRDHVELIDGVIVEMSPAGTRHNHFLSRLTTLFAPLYAQATPSVQGTLIVSEGQVFDPDFMLLKQRPGGYKGQLPSAPDVLLVVEGADSSLRRDLKVKLPRYAAAAISEYWVADLDKEIVIVHRAPQANGYAQVATMAGDQLLSPLAFPDFSFAARAAFD